jgi:hypothetical protein
LSRGYDDDAIHFFDAFLVIRRELRFRKTKFSRRLLPFRVHLGDEELGRHCMQIAKMVHPPSAQTQQQDSNHENKVLRISTRPGKTQFAARANWSFLPTAGHFLAKILCQASEFAFANEFGIAKLHCARAKFGVLKNGMRAAICQNKRFRAYKLPCACLS